MKRMITKEIKNDLEFQDDDNNDDDNYDDYEYDNGHGHGRD